MLPAPPARAQHLHARGPEDRPGLSGSCQARGWVEGEATPAAEMGVGIRALCRRNFLNLNFFRLQRVCSQDPGRRKSSSSSPQGAESFCLLGVLWAVAASRVLDTVEDGPGVLLNVPRLGFAWGLPAIGLGWSVSGRKAQGWGLALLSGGSAPVRSALWIGGDCLPVLHCSATAAPSLLRSLVSGPPVHPQPLGRGIRPHLLEGCLCFLGFFCKEVCLSLVDVSTHLFLQCGLVCIYFIP